MTRSLYFEDVTIFDGTAFFRGSLATDGSSITHIVRDGVIPTGGIPTARGEKMLVMPGMVNLHTHVPMAVFKGIAEDLPLKEWLEKRIFPLESQFISREMCRIAGQWGMAEMLLSGVTAFADMYFFEEEIATAAKEIGIKACIGEGVINFTAPTGRDPEETISYTVELIRKYRDDPWVFPCCAPHSPYLTEERYLCALAEIAKEYRVPFHIHLAETQHEQDASLARYGKREVERLDEIGVLSKYVIAAHCVWVDESEMRCMASRGVTVAHCPSSNLKLGSGIAPVAVMLQHGIPVAVATDGSASNNNLDLINEAELAAKVQKGIHRDPTLIPASTALSMVTSIPGKVLGYSFGRLIEGGSADIVLMNLGSCFTAPLYDPAAAVIYASSPATIVGVWVNGHRVVEEGRLLTIDVNILAREVERMAETVRRAL